MQLFVIEGLRACVEAGHPVPEEPFEISHDVYGAFDGPKTGRLRAMQKVSPPPISVTHNQMILLK